MIRQKFNRMNVSTRNIDGSRATLQRNDSENPSTVVLHKILSYI